ncbi:site-specific integrase [Candidatus Sulfurimonas baltica]|uniref:Site-specific integrase n=1 Tax=Candidatus Sulfurimonas baltica TaxID=2740404 RepID=A0A7S7LUR2_9BACT|nr:site-specific integrase [Candidatus Sulfurimonas baltica]QOY51695.1 site-specific integrase [Candidatus Sulfurimonas baltica]
MLLVTNKIAYMSIAINENVYYLEGVNKYYKYLKLIKCNALLTIENKLNSLYHFWLWSLSNDVEFDEDLQLYFARYLLALEEGFKITNISYLYEYNEDIEVLVFESKPKQSSTIEKEKRAVESFFKYMGTFKSKDYNLEKNFLSYNKQAKYNKGSSYGLKMSKYMQNILLDDVSVLASKNTNIKGDIKAFPFKLFDDLLLLAKPRERLLYLLYGTCAARLNQGLNLTYYDIDYASQNVWLIDPKSNNQLGYHGLSRKQFLHEIYNIDIETHPIHNKFNFKYPIPTNYKSRMPLFWLNSNYRKIFFDTLVEYSPLPESLRKPRHPFFFVRSSGKRLSSDEVYKSFKKHLQILSKKYPEYAYRLDGLGIHSLRHMFGSVMATIEAKLIMSGQPEKAHHIKWFTSNAMGHSNLSSTEIYFNRPWDVEIELGEFVQSLIESMQDSEYEPLTSNRRKKW